MADFGQSNFGQSIFGQPKFWPIHSWPKLEVSGLADFGQSNFGQSIFVCVVLCCGWCWCVFCCVFVVSCGCLSFVVVVRGVWLLFDHLAHDPSPRPLPSAAASGPPGLHTTTRELQTCTFDGPGASKHHQKTTRRHTVRDKKSETGGPHILGPISHPSGLHFFWVWAPSFGAMTHTRSRNGLPKLDWQNGLAKWVCQKWIGQKWNGQNWSNQDRQHGIGQSRSLPCRVCL